MSIINPDPRDWALLLPWFGSWNCLKNSSNGEPGGKVGRLFFLSSIIVVVEIFTTEGLNDSAKLAKLSGAFLAKEVRGASNINIVGKKNFNLKWWNF